MKFGFTLPSYTWPGLDYEMTYRVTKEMTRLRFTHRLGPSAERAWPLRWVVA